jgi:hypothetical protein
VILWLPAVFKLMPVTGVMCNAPFYEFLCFIIGNNPIVVSIINLLLVISGASLINYIIKDNEIAGKTSFLGMFFFVILSLSNTAYMDNNRFLIINLLLLLILNQLYKIPKTDFTLAPLYNASVLLGVAALFYLPILLMLPFIWISLLILRVSGWREYIVAAIGTGLPLFFAFIYYYFFDLTDTFIDNFYQAFTISFQIVGLKFFDLIILILLTGIIVSTFFMQINSLYEKNIALRQKLIINIWMFVFMLLLVIFNLADIKTILLASIPSTIILSNVLNNIKKLKWIDLYISLIVILIFTNQYYRFFDA